MIPLAQIFHEYASLYLVARMIDGVVAFTQKDGCSYIQVRIIIYEFI